MGRRNEKSARLNIEQTEKTNRENKKRNGRMDSAVGK